MTVINILEADQASVGDRVLWRGRQSGTLGGAATGGVVIVLEDGTRRLLPWHEAADALDVVHQ